MAEGGGPPSPALKPLGDYVVAEEMPGDDNGHRCRAASPYAEVARDFLASLGKMRRDGDGQKYRPPRPAQKPRGDFVVAKDAGRRQPP